MTRNQAIAVITITVWFTGYAAYTLAAAGTIESWLLAVLVATFPIAAWWESTRLKRRGASEAASMLLLWTMSASAAFAILVTYAADQTDCAGKPQ